MVEKRILNMFCTPLAALRVRLEERNATKRVKTGQTCADARGASPHFVAMQPFGRRPVCQNLLMRGAPASAFGFR
jgi:hypothetical protein